MAGRNRPSFQDFFQPTCGVAKNKTKQNFIFRPRGLWIELNVDSNLVTPGFIREAVIYVLAEFVR